MTITPNQPTSVTELAAVAAALRRSTVQVRSRRMVVGSGVIWKSGLIITNAHVVRGSHATVELSDGRVFDAACTVRDTHQDLAALKVAAVDNRAATIGDSDSLRVGQLVLAVGNPLGIVALTTGIIHAIDSKDAFSKWVQADVRLAPGNSGGPLADVQGRVIGINTLIAGGVALAVPSNVVERFVQLGEGPLLGVTIQPVLVPLETKRIFGLLILEVHRSSLAATANLLTGDVLIGADGKLFNALEDLGKALQVAPSNNIKLDFIRGGKRMTSVVRPHGHGVEAA